MGLPMAAFSLYLTAATLLLPLHILPCPLPNPGCYPPLPLPHESRSLHGPPLPCPASVSVWQAEGDSSTPLPAYLVSWWHWPTRRDRLCRRRDGSSRAITIEVLKHQESIHNINQSETSSSQS
uniref:Secreted protein n=1 Tax=Micrurus lemniscatus lemniscatus TaxID=129467 RepID=A0A2D4IQH0_MICLE